MGSDQEEVVDIRSGIAYLLVKWKWIVLAALIAAAAGGCFGYMKKQSGSKTETTVSYEEKAEKLRSGLSEADAVLAEQLAAQYQAYGLQLKSWGQYASGSALLLMDPYNYVKEDVQYAVSSDNISAVNSFTSTLLTQKEYEQIGALVGKDPLTASLQDIVIISNASINNTSAIILSDTPLNVTEMISDGGSEHKGILVVTILADNEEQAEGIRSIVDTAINEKVSKMTKAGIRVSVSNISAMTSSNDSNWLLSHQQTALYTMFQLQASRSNFIKNSVDTLGDSVKKYYNFLITEDPDAAPVASAGVSKKVNVKKYVMAGFLGGLLIAIVCVYLSFVFSDKIRTEGELRDNFGLPVLQRFGTGDAAGGLKKADPIKKKGLSLLRSCRTAETTEKGVKLLETELERRMSGEDCKKLFVAYDCGNEKARGTVELVAEKLSCGERTAQAGDPVGNDEDCRRLLGADAVIIAETLNRSTKKALKELTEICLRNGIKVLGCVTLFDADNY